MYADDTKFSKIINNNEDRKQLQRAIDNLSKWANDNGLTLNTDKTKHVSYGTKRSVSDQHSYYYLGTNRIERVLTIRDLGVIFDEQLTFVHHIESLLSKTSSMYGAAYRFAREIGNINIVMRIIKIYVQPIIEYASVIWDQNRIGHNTKLEKFLHLASRASLRAPFDVRHVNYINFNTRMTKLGALTFQKRRIITSILAIIKMIRGTLLSPLKEVIEKCRHIPTRSLRNTIPFDTHKIGLLSIKSPVAIALTNYNKYHHIFQEGDSTDVIKRKLKEFFLQANPENHETNEMQ